MAQSSFLASRFVQASGAVAFVLGMGVLAHALPVTFEPGMPLMAAQLNQNFDDVAARLAKLESVPTVALPVITEWASFESTVDSDSGPVETQTTSARYRRVGDTLEASIVSKFSRCIAPGPLRWRLPQGVETDPDKLASGDARVGSGTIVNQGPGAWTVRALAIVPHSDRTHALPDVATSSQTGGLTCAILGDGPRETLFYFSVPIRGWSVSH